MGGKRGHGGVLACAVLAAATAAAPAQAQREPLVSAAYWRDVCDGSRPGISHADQKQRCSIYLSSFQDVVDEYAEAGIRLFCAPDAMSTETVRGVFLRYVSEFEDAADFLPAGRTLVQALRQAYPCKRSD